MQYYLNTKQDSEDKALIIWKLFLELLRQYFPCRVTVRSKWDNGWKHPAHSQCSVLIRLSLAFFCSSFDQCRFHITAFKGNALGVPWPPYNFLFPQVFACGSSILMSSQTPTWSLTPWQPTPYHRLRQDHWPHSGQLKCHKVISCGPHPMDPNHSITALIGRLRFCALQRRYRRK